MRYRYWDSCVILGWLKGEADKKALCQGGIKLAEQGDLKIVTSFLTFTEVIWLKGKDPVPREDADQIRSFFANEYITPVQLTREIAERAQDLVWQHGVRPKDGVQLATALAAHEAKRMEQLDTFDSGLIKLSATLGDPPLRIGEPDFPVSMF